MSPRLSTMLALAAPCLASCYASHRLEDDRRRPDSGRDAAREDVSTRRDTGRDVGTDPPLDTWTPPPPYVCPDGHVPLPSELELDLLFVVDDSESMAEEQAALGEAFPRVLDALLQGDLDGDGVPDFPPVESLHVSVTSTNQGSPGAELCNVERRVSGGMFARFGEDACELDRRYLCHRRGDAVAPVVRAFGVASGLGTGGCPLEQPLECALQGLATTETELSFVSGEGRADRENVGFRREEALLGLVIVTDEDDCSVADRRFYRNESPYPGAEIERRCTTYPEALRAVEEVIEALPRVAGDDFILAAIAGVPSDLEGASLRRVLDDPRMQIRDGDNPSVLAPACRSSFGRATPARRIAEVVHGLGEVASLHSICRGDLRPAMETITARLGELMFRRACE